jgi:hypothetical protein
LLPDITPPIITITANDNLESFDSTTEAMTFTITLDRDYGLGSNLEFIATECVNMTTTSTGTVFTVACSANMFRTVSVMVPENAVTDELGRGNAEVSFYLLSSQSAIMFYLTEFHLNSFV